MNKNDTIWSWLTEGLEDADKKLKLYAIYNDGDEVGELAAYSEDEAVDECYNGAFGFCTSDDMFRAELVEDPKQIAEYEKNWGEKLYNLEEIAEREKEQADESLEEHINDRPADIESDQVLQGTDNAVVDCPVAKVIAHSEDEKPLDCKMKKHVLEEPLAGEEVDVELYEDKDVDYVEYMHSYCNALEPHMDELRKIDDVEELKKAILNIVGEDPDVNNTEKKNKFVWLIKNKKWSSPANILAYLNKAMEKARGIEVKVDDKGELIKDESLTEAKKDEEEIPPDPEAVKLEVHATLNNLVADEIEAINGYEDAKTEILDAPVEHKDAIIDTIDHIKDEEKEHIDELIDATAEVPFGKDTEAPAKEEPVEEPAVEEPFEQDFPEVEEELEENVYTPFDSDAQVGNKIKIISMEGEPEYSGKTGTIDHIDGIGQLHGTWGGCAVVPGVDEFEIIADESLTEDAEEQTESPWYLQQGENGEPEFIGWAKSLDDMIDKMVKSHDSNRIYEDTYIDEVDKDLYLYMKKEGILDDEDIEKLDAYFGSSEAKKESLEEASSAETKAFKNGGKDLDDLVQGKAIARIKDPAARDAAVAAVKAGRSDVVKDFTGDRKEDQALASYEKKANAMAKAGVNEEVENPFALEFESYDVYGEKVESLNASEEAPSEHETENESENKTLNE